MNIDVTTVRLQATSPDDRTNDPAVEATPAGPFHTVIGSDAERIVDLELALAQMRDRWMRSEAEITNVRARGKRDMEEARHFAIQKFAADIVEMVENLQRGIASLPAPTDREPQIVTRLREGFNGVEHGFVSLLERNGIARHDPTGSAFDPGLHQAVDQKVSAGHAPGTVLQAWTSAWTLNGRLLRPAMVVVAAASRSRAGP